VTVAAFIANVFHLRMKPKRGLLIRVGADQSDGGGNWNGLVDSKDWSFAYIPIPEEKPIRPGLEKPYALIAPALQPFGLPLPVHLSPRQMHLDPDFSWLSYGDQGQRALQIKGSNADGIWQPGDILVFYAGLRDIRQPRHVPGALVYAIIGLFVIDSILEAPTVEQSAWDQNAHTRRLLSPDGSDIVVRARSGISGRLDRCIPIGNFRNRAYRVREELLQTWGGITSKDGYLQRSARLPRLKNPALFYAWFQNQNPRLLHRNN